MTRRGAAAGQTPCRIALDAARDAALRETGVRVYRKLRGEGVGPESSECYFEWVVGPGQLGLSDELVLGAWAAFLRALPT